MSNFIDLKNKKFGRLLVIERNFGTKRTTWKCRCECGKETIVLSFNLKSGGTKSCGCLNKESTNKTHGQRYTKTYTSWRSMIKRCTNENHRSYPYYGGRGIIICKEWLDSYESFYKDMKDRPENYTLDRIDSNGNYEVSNCKWSTKTEQNCNRRDNIKVSDGDEEVALSEYCRRYSLKYRTILSRLRRGIEFKEAIF